MKTRNKQVKTCELASYLEILLKTNRFEARGDEKWPVN
jgi:hypothetical protein